MKCDHYDNSFSYIPVSSIVAISSYGSGHETAAVLLPGFAINW